MIVLNRCPHCSHYFKESLKNFFEINGPFPWNNCSHCEMFYYTTRHTGAWLKLPIYHLFMFRSENHIEYNIWEDGGTSDQKLILNQVVGQLKSSKAFYREFHKASELLYKFEEERIFK